MISRDTVIERALAFPMDAVVARYAKDLELSMDVAREHEREMKRYLALCALNPSAGYAMAGPIDELWHTFVVFTTEYARFCDQVAGEFIHHVPTSEDEDVEPLRTSYHRFLNDYETTFGEQAPEHIWPRGL